MEIIFERPPMFKEINARFKIAGTNVIFAWGDVIYNPSRVQIPPFLMAHEKVHCLRQLKYPSMEDWWGRYLEDPLFRLAEELPAHRAEYEAQMSPNSNRKARRGIMKQTAKRLAAPLYGRMVSEKEAQILLRAA